MNLKEILIILIILILIITIVSLIIFESPYINESSLNQSFNYSEIDIFIKRNWY